MYNMDVLFETVSKRGNVCVGLDTTIEYIPKNEHCSSRAEAVLAYNKAIINATSDIAACYKVQIACYEEMGLEGLDVYSKTLKMLRGQGSLVIADIKRGDIADTASRYARAHFEGDFEADFVTLSPYLGMDSIEPWLEWADKKGKGAFILMRTSNKGRQDFECLTLKDGSRKLYDAVGEELSKLAAARTGKYGYGAFGAVAGADSQTDEERKEAEEIRKRYGNLFFLIPGFGAQGGAAGNAALFLKDGNGGVVNASRSILKAWQDRALDPAKIDNDAAAQAAREAAIEMRDSILKALHVSI